jgi:hypothetical protein
MAEISKAILVQGLAICAVLYYTGLAIYRLFFHPLAKFPGPRLAAMSRWYEAYYDVIKDGQYTFKIADLHKKYGMLLAPYHQDVVPYLKIS